jgi:agmatinase
MNWLSREQRFLGLEDSAANPEAARCIVLPAPFERTSSWGAGSAEGPGAILAASQQVELFDCGTGTTPWRDCGGIATRAPLTAGADGAAFNAALHRETRKWLAEDRFVITVGGEHTSVIGAIRAHCEVFPDLTVLQLDAHADLRDAYEGDRWSHACAMRRVLDFHDHLVQTGIRSCEEDEWRLAQRLTIPIIRAADIHAMESRGEDWIGSVIAPLRKRVYISFDCDVLDPAVLPATGTPEPGGLTWRQADALLRRLCAEREVAGLDISELAPIAGLRYPEFTMAKLMYRFLGYRFRSR